LARRKSDSDHFKLNKFATEKEDNYVVVSSNIHRIATSSKQLVKQHKEYDKCMQALSNGLTDPRSDLDSIRSAKKDRVPGTCEWILSHDRYLSWLTHEGPQLLWLKGGPGIGKTMMSTFLVETFTQLARKQPQITLAYYFCDAKDERRQKATSVLRGLLIQLLARRPILFEHIKDDFSQRSHDLFADFYALWRIFVRTTKDPKAREVYCLIDALDECEYISRTTLLSELKRLFSPSQMGEKFSVKFIVTSRPDVDIHESFPSLQLESTVRADIFTFINVRVDKISNDNNYPPGLLEDIKRDLTQNSGGTFLWASLVIDDLERTPLHEAREKLKTLPRTLYEVYNRILSQIGARSKDVEMVLRLIVVARRPLAPYEFAMALAIATQRWRGKKMPPESFLDELKDAFKICEPLVYYDNENNTINLVHQSAYEYLKNGYLRANDILSKYHVDLDKANFLMFEACWKSLSMEFLHCSEPPKLVSMTTYWTFAATRAPFVSYASTEWIYHVTATSPALIANFEWECINDMPSLRDSWLHVEACEGRPAVVQLLLGNGADLTVNNNGYTALHWAAKRGHEKVARLLLNRGADVNQPTWRREQGPNWFPIRLSFRFNNISDFAWPVPGQEPPGPKEVEGMVQESGDGNTALHLAAGQGHDSVVQLLLRNGAHILALNPKASTALELAIEAKKEKVVRLLKWRVRLIKLILLACTLGLTAFYGLPTFKHAFWVLSKTLLLYFGLPLALLEILIRLTGRQFGAFYIRISLYIFIPVIIYIANIFLSVLISLLSSWIGLFLVLKVIRPLGVGTISWKMDIGESLWRLVVS
jgi:hypothetical protein